MDKSCKIANYECKYELKMDGAESARIPDMRWWTWTFVDGEIEIIWKVVREVNCQVNFILTL